MGVLALGRAGEALVAVVVGSCLCTRRHGHARLDAGFVRGVVELAGPLVGAGGHEGSGMAGQ